MHLRLRRAALKSKTHIHCIWTCESTASVHGCVCVSVVSAHVAKLKFTVFCFSGVSLKNPSPVFKEVANQINIWYSCTPKSFNASYKKLLTTIVYNKLVPLVISASHKKWSRKEKTIAAVYAQRNFFLLFSSSNWFSWSWILILFNFFFNDAILYVM